MVATMAEIAKRPMERSVHAAERDTERFVQLQIPSGEELKQIRELLNIGQREIAAKAGIALGTLSAIENELGGCQDSMELLHATLREQILGATHRLLAAQRILFGVRGRVA